MQNSERLHLAPARDDRTDADQRPGGAVDADVGAALTARRRCELDRLAMHKRMSRPIVEGDTAPSHQGRLGWLEA